MIDGEATLRIWAVDVEVAGVVYTIPPRPAADWLAVVAAGSLLNVVPGLLDDPSTLDDRLSSGELVEECQAAARDAISEAAGCKWWTATRLARAVLDTGVIGELTLRGVDGTRISFAAYLAAVYQLAARSMEDTKRAQLDAELQLPPVGMAPEDWFDEDHAGDLFEAAMARGG